MREWWARPSGRPTSVTDHPADATLCPGGLASRRAVRVGVAPAAARAHGGKSVIGRWVAELRAWLPRGEGLEREAWEHRHRLLLAIVWAHVALLPVYAAIEGRLGPGTVFDI